MSIENGTKINQLLSTQPSGAVMLSSWLKKQGYSPGLQHRYRQSQWLESMGAGAMIRAGDNVEYEGAIYALQTQAGMTVHPGGRTALGLQGKAHYLELAVKRVTLFGGAKEKLPLWFQKHDWGVAVNYHHTSFLPPDAGMVDVEIKTFSIKVSSPARALMECLYLAPEKQPLMECYELMEGMNNLRPQLVQSLLEQCRSVKVKRLFLYLAEKAGHEWVQHLNLSKVDFGKGKRALVKEGTYVEKYQITVPRELLETPFNYLMNNRQRILEVFSGRDEKLLNKEIPYLLKAWIHRDGAISVELSEFFSRLLLNNPKYVMKMFSQHSTEFDAWLDRLGHSMFTEFVTGTPKNLLTLKEKISAALRVYLDTELSEPFKTMARRILERVEGISIQVVD